MGTLAWQLNVRFNKLAVNQDTKINLHTNLYVIWKPQQKEI